MYVNLLGRSGFRLRRIIKPITATSIVEADLGNDVHTLLH